MPVKASSIRMNQLCKQVSIETPDNRREFNGVFCFDVPVPDVPPEGARIQVLCAGVCYKRRASSETGTPPPSPAIKGIRDASFFPGYEVSGIIDALGPDVPDELGLTEGARVVVYPYEGLPSINTGYAEYISVPHAKYLVTIPNELDMQVASMLPSGALWAAAAVQMVADVASNLDLQSGDSHCNVLLVGTGGLTLWVLRVAAHYLAPNKNIRITVATLKDDAVNLEQEKDGWNVVYWSEDVYESHLVERTKDACKGLVDIVLDFGATQRSLARSLRCIRPNNGVILVGEESWESLSSKFAKQLQEANAELRPISMGTLSQLKELVELTASGKITPPPYSLFAVEDACHAIRKLSQSTIKGRAVLEFQKRT